MIITVTLNAAIDKTLAVPNFRLGGRHRAVEQTSMAGGKGVNVARALKALGQPVIATGVAGGPTGTRIIEQLTEEAILNDFVRIREESRMSTAVVDPTSGEQTEINERGPAVSEAELELFVDKLLYLAQGAARLRLLRKPAARRAGPTSTRELVEELHRAGRDDACSTRRASRCASRTRAAPSVVTPNELEAEELVGHEFSDDDDRGRPSGRSSRWAPREAIMTLPDGCLGAASATRRRTRRRLCRATLEPLEPRLVGRLGRRLPGRLRGGPLRRPPGRRSACASASHAAPSRPSTSAPACSTRARSSA